MLQRKQANNIVVESLMLMHLQNTSMPCTRLLDFKQHQKSACTKDHIAIIMLKVITCIQVQTEDLLWLLVEVIA